MQTSTIDTASLQTQSGTTNLPAGPEPSCWWVGIAGMGSCTSWQAAGRVDVGGTGVLTEEAWGAGAGAASASGVRQHGASSFEGASASAGSLCAACSVNTGTAVADAEFPTVLLTVWGVMAGRTCVLAPA